MLIVDRIEGETAVVEVSVGKFVDVPLKDIAGDVTGGSVLRKTGAGTYAVDEDATDERASRIQAKARRLFR